MITIVTAFNRADILARTIPQVLSVTGSRVVLLDNGSESPIVVDGAPVVSHRLPVNVGNYKAFEIGLALAGELGEEIVAFLHSDVFLYDIGWDGRVQGLFDGDPGLGLVGFAASNEVESHGGRGMGTVTNYQGRQECGGAAAVHGRLGTGFEYVAQVDGMAMVFRASALRSVGFRDGFPIHHFYDRLMSCQMLEAGWRVGYLGVACDHLNGRTTMFEQGYYDLARQWCEARGIANKGNWDLTVYKEAERQFLDEYAVRKKFIPLRVGRKGEIVR